MKNTINRFSPLSLRNNIILSNRVVVPPMASETADSNGYATDKTISHYSRLSECGAGLIFVEYSFIHLSGRSEANQLGINHDDQINNLCLITEEIHKSGAIAGIQLTHSGGKTERCFTDGSLHSPSGIIVPVKDKNLERPKQMSLSDIKNLREWFLKAVERAVKANFDMVELHAAHGYGLNQWISPLTNKRSDQYGGNLQKNSQLLVEIVSEIRSLYPNLLLSVRMPGQDFIEGGLTISDCIFIAKLLQETGVDIINISSGIGGWKRPRTRLGEGYLIEEASMIQGQVSIPVIGVGGIETGTYIDNLLNNQKVSLTAVGRAILKDPSAWSKNQLRSIHHA
jgi:NADPH2 dehydrogenase